MRGDQGLPKAESAVTGGDFGLCEHFKTRRGEARNKSFLQVDVLERASTQADALEPRAIPEQVRQPQEDLNQRIVESAADEAGTLAACEV